VIEKTISNFFTRAIYEKKEFFLGERNENGVWKMEGLQQSVSPKKTIT
jgi:hypothetical protein